MDAQMRLYWETFEQFFSTQDIIDTLHSPMTNYLDELCDGSIVDIGCGQNSYLLKHFGTDRTLIAIDNDQYQLDALKKRFD